MYFTPNPLAVSAGLSRCPLPLRMLPVRSLVKGAFILAAFSTACIHHKEPAGASVVPCSPGKTSSLQAGCGSPLILFKCWEWSSALFLILMQVKLLLTNIATEHTGSHRIGLVILNTLPHNVRVHLSTPMSTAAPVIPPPGGRALSQCAFARLLPWEEHSQGMAGR